MDNLNTNQITLGNMNTFVATDVPNPTDFPNSDVPEVTGESANLSDKTKLEVKNTTDNSDGGGDNSQNMLIIGGLLALLFLFRKKL
jgi:hypothetical protein